MLGVWEVGPEVMFSVGIGFEHAVVIVLQLLMAIVGVYGGTVVSSSATQLLLASNIHFNYKCIPFNLHIENIYHEYWNLERILKE